MNNNSFDIILNTLGSSLELANDNIIIIFNTSKYYLLPGNYSTIRYHRKVIKIFLFKFIDLELVLLANLLLIIFILSLFRSFISKKIVYESLLKRNRANTLPEARNPGSS